MANSDLGETWVSTHLECGTGGKVKRMMGVVRPVPCCCPQRDELHPGNNFHSKCFALIQYLANSEERRGREEKNARLILRIIAATFSLALPSICESRGCEEAHDNLMRSCGTTCKNLTHLSSSLV